MTNPGVGVGVGVAALFFLVLLTATADALGTTSPLAISHATGTVCGVLAGVSPRSVRCARVGDIEDFPLFPNISFASVSGGRDFLCGLRSGGTSFFCWNPAGGARPKRVYNRGVRLEEFTVGEDHICASSNQTGLRWWRGGNRLPDRPVEGKFRSLTSGNGFTCAILVNSSRVRCWGSQGGPADVIQAGFADTPMSTIVAGGSHACGIDSNGSLICRGENGSGQLNSPPRSSPFEFTKLAMGQNHGCAIRKPNNTVVCWGGTGGSYVPVNESLLWIVAGGDLTCGVLRLNFSGSRVMSRQRSGPSSMKHNDRAEEFSFGELAEATKNFSLETKIGAGSFGTVYRGKLSDGREVAIKRGESGPRAKKFQEKESAFQSELSFLSRLHHKHLVGLVGYCEDREERLLVYEYMKNGALFDHLHTARGNGSGNGAGGSGLLNSWKLRIKILLDAARGIEYLHNYAVPPIIHRDIKSSNILLDGSWTAKVSDFGLSLNGPEFSGGHLALKAAGTVGYMDPEYYGLHHLTVKSDVYGLGVVMLEVLTGRRAIFKDGDGNPISVVEYTGPRIAEGEVGRVLDARVGAPGQSEAEAVELVAYTAVHCVSLESRERPTMTDIVANLESALALCDDSHGSISSASNSFASYD
ncbi:hypothetical protein Taro_021315 [Colocasia esculenta]|uniref:non-specific serine/threonine protein kinase n=1 Tax=Colocasia esculenta TaxID=4460 RepID=A0A843VB32_COLES|nr:hypothetical protein [Colocasia esculenta]